MATSNLKVLLAFILSLGELVASVTKGVSFSLVGKLIEVARTAVPALAHASDALKEYANMTDSEAVDIEQYVVTEFDIEDDKVEGVIETALKVAVELHGLVKFLLPKS